MPHEDREPYLDRACAGDVRLRELVMGMVRAHEGSVELLQRRSAHQSQGAPSCSLTEKPGDRIGGYKLLQKLGEGGCGIVYMAEQEEPVKRRVALKVIKLGMDTKETVARFEAERQALALMDHPNIAKVLDGGSSFTGRPFFVMELVPGIPISRYCDEHRLNPIERLKVFLLVCQAVQHAHQKGIIHRDLKPSNILVADYDGTPAPKVIDFGIAKAIAGQTLTDKTLFTAFEQFLGTPAYMSPEQAKLSDLDIDTRADIYSLGVLLYELLTGKTPFDTRRLIQAGLDEARRIIREEDPPRPSTRLSTLDAAEQTTVAWHRQSELPRLVSALRGDLDWIIMKSLDKERARRYETANGLARDIQRYLDTEPVLARPPSPLYEFQKTVRRHKVVFVAVTAIMLALVVGVLVSTAEAVRAKRAEREQGRLREREQQARSKADTQQRIARQRAYAADMNLTQMAIGDYDFGRALEILNYQRPEPGQEDLRGWEWRKLWQFCQTEALGELCRQSNSVSSLAVSHDGKWLAIGENRDGRISVWDLRKRKEAAHWRGSEAEVVCAFSPREPLLAFSVATSQPHMNSHHSVRFWNPETQETAGADIPLPDYCRGIAFSADGRTLSTFTVDDRLSLWRVPEGRRLATFHIPLQHGMDLPLAAALSLDAHFAAYAAPGGWIHILDLVTGKELWTAQGAHDFIWAVSISPDGKTVASLGSSDPALRLWDLASGKEFAHALEDNMGGVGGMVFWPNGKRIAAIHANHNIRIYDISDPAQLGPLVGQFRGHQTEIWTIALLPDQSTLVTGSKDGSVWLWDSNASWYSGMSTPLRTPVSAWRFAPDSRSVLALDQQGRVAKWQGDGFRNEQYLFVAGTNIAQSNFSPDAQLLAVALTNSVIQIWDVPRRVLLHQLAVLAKRTISPGSGLLFLDHGRKLLILDPQDKLHEWDLTNWQEVQSWPGPADAMTVAVSPDEAWCLALGRSGSHCPAVLRALVTGQELRAVLDMASVEDSTFSPDGKLFAAVSSFDGAKLWEAANFNETTPFADFLRATSVCFSPNGKRLAIGEAGTGVAEDGAGLRLWDVFMWPGSGPRVTCSVPPPSPRTARLSVL
jgi:serine/threonine protein kinase/WD40 repeat protein